MALVTCRECRRQVSSSAKQCVHCGAPTKAKLGGGAVILTLFTIGGLLYLLSDRPKTAPKPETAEEIARTACYMAQEYVKMVLKAPKSAEFADCYRQSAIAKIGTSPAQYRVRGYVDAQNAFSAMIRTRFVADVEQVDAKAGTWRLIDLEM